MKNNTVHTINKPWIEKTSTEDLKNCEFGKMRFAFMSWPVKYLHPHIHLIVTAGGLSLNGKRWIATDPKFLMHHGGLKKRWKYQVTTRMKSSQRQSDYSGINPLQCPNCDKALTFVGCFFGYWNPLQHLFEKAGKDATIAAALLRPG